MEKNQNSKKKYLTVQFSISICATGAALVWGSGCLKPAAVDEASVSQRYLYVSAGTCYAGGNTTFTNTTSSNLVYRINLTTGVKESTLADYNSSPSLVGDSPIAIANLDQGSIYVLVDNTAAGSRRIEKLSKRSDSAREIFSNNTSALSAALKNMRSLSNGDLLISKGTAIEKITSANVRITKGASPFISAPAAPCATATTLISKVTALGNEFVAFLHAGASNNRFGFVKPEGYAVAGDCSPAQAAPNTAAFPVAVAYDKTNAKLIVAYAGTSTATDINSIYVYEITETASSVSIGASHKIYDANLYPATYPYLLYGVSEMVLDPNDNSLYVATAINTATAVANFAIEKLSYDPSQIGVDNTKVLTRKTARSFYEYGSDTKCISSMIIAD